jgi:aminopeptidase-like protein
MTQRLESNGRGDRKSSPRVMPPTPTLLSSMPLSKKLDCTEMSALGEELHRFAAELYPICRSITGDGIRQTLKAIQEHIPLQIFEVPTGTTVFDWTVPKEWNIRDAYIKDSSGRRVVDFRESNLHVLNYSVPIRTTMSLSDIRAHLFTIPTHPDWIPYRTSYYKEDWGFCLSHNQLVAMTEGDYEVCIDSTLAEGNLTYGEYFLPGRATDEILISCHACHPSLANDNLSGLTVATALAKGLAERSSDRHYSYRFLFLPGTIGAITWLARTPEAASRVRHGLVLTCIGDKAPFHYKKSRMGDAEIDRAVTHTLAYLTEAPEILEFSPYGYDERQYCSPGFNLAVGCLMRSVWGSFPEYHTSADNMNFIKPECLAESLRVCTSTFEVLENNRRYRNLSPFCEPQLGRRGLYRSISSEPGANEMNARLWVLNLSDGENSLLDIAERARLPFSVILEAAELLRENGLLELVPEARRRENAPASMAHRNIGQNS